jgi:hypothetical protein
LDKEKDSLFDWRSYGYASDCFYVVADFLESQAHSIFFIYSSWGNYCYLLLIQE